jgi:hypothetical protein
VEITITQILDDLRTADEIVRRFERRYWLSSADFYSLYRQGLLDDGERTEDYALWAGFHLIEQDREAALGLLSAERVRQLRAHALVIDPREPILRTKNGTTFPARADYEALLTNLSKAYPDIASSTLRLRNAGAPTAIVDGEVHFSNGLKLRVIEALDFKVGRLQGYAYSVWRGDQKLGWFDPSPPGDDPMLAATFPHHYHDLAGSDEERQAAPGLSFDAPNLPALIAHCRKLGQPNGATAASLSAPTGANGS